MPSECRLDVGLFSTWRCFVRLTADQSASWEHPHEIGLFVIGCAPVVGSGRNSTVQYNSGMAPDPRAIHISTDGSCYKNPGGRSGCAAVVHYPDHLDRGDEQIVDFGCEESSNNRMELLACIRVLKWIRVKP
jgi:hypothetical protein